MDGLKKSSSSSCTRKKNKLKVVYISSPMKVKTSASKFRALVQELTGRHSDISRYNHGGCFSDGGGGGGVPAAAMTAADAGGGGKEVECRSGEEGVVSSSGSEESYSFLDDVFRSELMVDDRFEGMFPSYSLYDSCL